VYLIFPKEFVIIASATRLEKLTTLTQTLWYHKGLLFRLEKHNAWKHNDEHYVKFEI